MAFDFNNLSWNCQTHKSLTLNHYNSSCYIEYMTEGTMQKKKLAVGWFSFTCCEDSTILLTELLNDNFDAWRKVVDFKYIRPLKTKNDPTNLDVAFIEGAASSQKQEDEMRK